VPTSKNPIDVKMERLKTLKSAYILEADGAMTRGLEDAARELFVKAGEMESELAELFGAKNEAKNRRVSLFSAGSCFFRARQYGRAVDAFQQVADEIPEARDLMAQCEGKADVPLAGAAEGLQALVGLLIELRVIEPKDWAGALAAHR
jgi:hypothetical protein